MKKIILGVLLFWQTSFANVLGEMQTFAPNTDGLDFITVHSARPLAEGYFAFSNYLNYAKDHLLVYDNFPGQNSVDYSNHLVEYDFGIAYGLANGFQVSLMTPVLLDYQGEDLNGLQIDVSEGWHSLRPGMKWTFHKGAKSMWAALLSVDFPQVSNSPYTGIDPKPILNLELATLLRSGKSSHGFNIGYRKRQPSDAPVDAKMFPLKDQLIASYGYTMPVFQKSRLVFETFASYPIDKDPYDNAVDASSVDVLLAMKHLWWKYVRFDWGVTVEPGVKSLAPSWRGFAGVMYYWKNDWSDKSNPVIDEQLQPDVVMTVAPDGEPIVPNESRVFTAVGGTEPYRCYKIVGFGTFDSSTCTYTAADSEDTEVVIEFEDANGQKAQGRLVPQRDPFTVRGPEEDVFVRSVTPIEAFGGQKPYVFSIISGGGSIDSRGAFRAPGQPGVSVVQVRDAMGEERKATVRTKAIPKADKEIRLGNLKFIFGKDELNDYSKRDMEKNIQQLKGERIREVVVEGHTDSVGSNESNLVLSEKRAQVVKQILIARLQLKASQVKAVGFGEEIPLASNKTARGREVNRRVELKVYFAR